MTVNRKTATCRWCQQVFTLTYKRHDNPKFCNQSCYHAWREATKKPPKLQKATCHPDQPHAAFGLCNTCYKKDHHRRKPEMYRQASRRHLLMKAYGLSLEEYDQLFELQLGLCAICHEPGTTKRGLVVDHCHRTNNVRMLLCTNCNSGLGAFKDSCETLRSALEYLIRHGGGS